VTFEKISVLIPTRHRVARLDTLLTSYELTASDGNSELVFRVDDDDAETIAFLRCYDHQLVVGPRHRGYASMGQFFNEAAAAATGDVLMCGNDDMVFRTAQWPTRILQKANEYPDGFFDIGVMTFNEGAYPFATVSRRLVDALGFISDPRIFWVDIYLRDVMAAFGRLVPLHSVRIDHDWAGFRPDQVFLDSPRTVPQIYWSTTHVEAVRDAVEQLKERVCLPSR
jgi:hypothetical protein